MSDVFYVMTTKSMYKRSKGSVSRAVRNPLEPYTSILLLDFEGPRNRKTPWATWFEVDRISRSTYYRKKKNQ